MNKFIAGQRWYSEGEPELGLGLIQEYGSKRVTVLFPLSQELRTYNALQAPLKRFILEPETSFKTEDGTEHIVSKRQENNGIYFYLTETELIVQETQISSKIELNSAKDRIFAGSYDPANFFEMRYQSYLALRNYQQLAHKGFLGAGIRLLPHQIYIAQKSLSEHPIRAMLCDEVGLGKTIEAALILNALIKKELTTRHLIIVPSSLVNQWFVELFKKFQLSFNIWDEDTDVEECPNIILGINQIKENPDIVDQVLSPYKWDTLIIDEAHQNDYSGSFSFLRDIAKEATACLLLSATPEVLGREKFFQQLNFLDPFKYSDKDKFYKEQDEAREVSELIRNYDPQKLSHHLDQEIIEQGKEAAIQALIDRYGTGRSYYRNSRSHLDQQLFKARKKHLHRIELSGQITDGLVIDQKIALLHEKLLELKNEKVLVIAHSRQLINKIQRSLLELGNFKIALFSSEQSLLERDRQAAYFAEENGAQLLLCTEIGSEGRNFEFCSHLFLFDLPKVPDQMEQRIGRLDRIGQKRDIQIYVPFIAQSFEEILVTYYDKVLSLFDCTTPGVGSFHQTCHDELQELLKAPFTDSSLSNFIDKSMKQFEDFQAQLKEGRNYLIERNSYNHDIAVAVIDEILKFEKDNNVATYMQDVCETVGIKMEELNAETVFFQPLDNMFIPSFPALTSEGKSFATTRDQAIKRDELQLLSWESPIVRGAMDIFINSPVGNTAIVASERLKGPIAIESIFTLQCADLFKYISSRFLPLTPMRILLNESGKDITKDLPKKLMDQSLQKVNETPSLPNDVVKALLEQAKSIVESKAKSYKAKAMENAKSYYQRERSRIQQLNFDKDVKAKSLEKLNQLEQNVLGSIEQANIQLDAIRIVIKI